MKLKKDISLELKNELNLIRDTYIAVIENRQREMTVDDVKNGIKCYQIVGFNELPDLLSDSDEDIEKFVDEWFCNPPTKKHQLKVEISRKLLQGEFL